MSKYTTGEMAKLCNVSVRTVQYYDSRSILVPHELSEGGRRLYSDDDLKKLKLICFLRNTGLSIDTIGSILTEGNSSNVISALLAQQSQLLKDEIDNRKTKLRTVEQLTREIKSWPSFSVETIGDIAFTMEKQKKLRKVHLTMLITGLFMSATTVGGLLFWSFMGSWLPFVIGIPAVILCGILITRFYYQKTAYICPQCHAVFKPDFKEFIWAAHTPKTRKLTCTECGHKGFSIETYYENTNEAGAQN